MNKLLAALVALAALCATPLGASAQVMNYRDATNGVRLTREVAASAPNSSTAAEACRVLKAGPGQLYSVSGYAGAASWIMVFNATSAPVDGAVTPVAWAYTPSSGSWSIDYGIVPAILNTGITVCASSTGPLTKTAISTNNVFSGRVQ